MSRVRQRPLKTEQYEPNVRVTEVTCQKNDKSVSDRMRTRLNESLILAQDERWRRA